MKTFSIYRGQSRTGMGEGPGRPVPHGEQYLAADPPLAEEAEVLSAARPWMTLDWRPADEQALGDRIEAWSCFPCGDLRFIVRLSSAGIYDRRAAYFAHGRAFPSSQFAGVSDPGAYLGRSDVFETPWRDSPRPPQPPLPEPEMVRPAQVLEEPAAAGALLAHLYQGLVGGYPVVMAVPVSDFEAGGPVHALVSFARAALPLGLKTDCRIRVFTRLPELFLRHLRADLVVVPENEAGNALAARRDAALLDRKGTLREGRDLSREAGGYAEAVLRRVLRLPEGLLAFSGAISQYLPKDRLPGEKELARVPAIYNLLAARTDPATLGKWIRTSLLSQVNERPTGLSWDALIRPEDWRCLAFGDLAEILVTEAASEEARTLVRLAEAEARRPERRELVSEEWLRKRWNELTGERRATLLARLLGSTEAGRPLVDPGVAARLSSSLPLSDLLAAGGSTPSLLEAERQAGLLGPRSSEIADLAAAGRDPGSASVLARATAEGLLLPAWALRLLEEPDDVVLRAAARILPVATTSLQWLDVLDRLFGRLLRAAHLPPTLWPPLAEALDRTEPDDPASGFESCLALTELLFRSRWPDREVAVNRAWRVAARLSDRVEQKWFLERVIDPEWKSLQPDRLVSPEGRLTLPWAQNFSGLLLESEQVRDHLDTNILLSFAHDQSDLGPWLDPRMESEPDRTTAALLRADLWACWRNGSALSGNARRKAALAWLGSQVWRSRGAPEARLEDWKRVVADLDDLTSDELRGLFHSSRPPWPWITPFQDEQFRDLCRLGQGEPGALADAPWENEQKMLSVVQRWIKKRQEAEAEEARKKNLAVSATAAVSRSTAIRLSSQPDLDALARGRLDNGIWSRVAAELRAYGNSNSRKEHPVADLARRLRDVLPKLSESDRTLLESKGWDNFSALTRIHPLVLQESRGKGSLPALEMATLLLPCLGIGGAALRLLHLEAARSHLRRPEWWRALLAGVSARARWSGEREEVALALIHQAIPGLFSRLAKPASAPEIPEVLEVFQERMEQLYHDQGLRLVRSFVSRSNHEAGAAR